MNAVKQPDSLKAMKVFGVFTVLVLIVAVFRIVRFLTESWEKSQWTEERITHALGISIPDDASNVHLEGERNGYGHYFILDFDASPSTLSSFAAHFCDGVLHSGYDPFNDIEIAHSVDSPYTVMIEYIYPYQVRPIITRFYAYSPITPASTFGNECYSYDETGHISGTAKLIVDKSNPESHQIHLEYYGHSYAYPRNLDYMAIRPFENFPILLLGPSQVNEDRYKVYRSLLIEIDPLSYLSDDEHWNWLVGSDIQFAIDGNDLPEAYVSAYGLLTPRHDEQGAPFVENNRYFNYYYTEDDWSEAEHELEIEVRGASGQYHSLTWNFYAD